MCLSPFTTKNQDRVPCGKCPPCCARRISQWSFRLAQHFKSCKTAYFITLTYDTDNLPFTHQGRTTIRKRDVQLFFKRLRKRNNRSGLSIKYFLVGEYGARTKRPHYHAIIFNAELNTILPSWGLGEVYHGTVTDQSVGYTLKYMYKLCKVGKSRNDDRTPTFQLMSKGLGLSYLTPNMIAWHNAQLGRMYCPLLDGKKASMPRYYKEKIFTFSMRQLNAEYIKCSIEKKDAFYQKSVDPTALYIQKKSAVAESFKRQKLHNLLNAKI